jgi:hypothetical protein
MSLNREKPSTNLIITLLIVISFTILYGYLAIRSVGTYNDDDITHLLIAQYSWKHFYLFLNEWGRPTFTILYSPVAWLGLTATRIYSAFLAGGTCLLGAYLAYLYRVRWYWLGALFIGFQPEFIKQGYSVLTELTFALFFCITLIFYKKENWLWMAIFAGWLPLARYESIPIVIIFGIILCRQKKFKYLVFLILPILIQNCFNAIYFHKLTTILFPLDKLLGFRSMGSVPKYKIGTPFYYVIHSPQIFGGFIFILAVISVFKEKFGLLQLFSILSIVILDLTYSYFPGAGVAGYTRYLVTISPCIGVLAAIGLEKFFDIPGSRKRSLIYLSVYFVLAIWLWEIGEKIGCLIPVALMIITLGKTIPIHIQKIAQAVVLAGVALLTIPGIKPFPISNDQKVIWNTGEWYRTSPYRDQLVMGSNMNFCFAARIDCYDQTKKITITKEHLLNGQTGSLVIWDGHYAENLKDRATLKNILDSNAYQLIQTENVKDFSVKVYQKVLK